jgi:hypothetical protein
MTPDPDKTLGAIEGRLGQFNQPQERPNSVIFQITSTLLWRDFMGVGLSAHCC